MGRRDSDLYQKKSLSQVFLTTEWPVQRMVEKLTAWGARRVLEIGPGGGILTRALLDAGFTVTAVEKDDRFAERMRDYGRLRPADAKGSLEVVNADILRFDWDAWIDADKSKSAVAGNIPYSISSPILMQGIAAIDRLAGMILMTQLEFAARIVGKSNTKDYGSLSVYAQLRADINMEFTVPRTCFHPVPKVDSAVMSIYAKRDKLAPELLKKVESVTRAAFTQRRKKLRNSVRQFLGEDREAASPIDLERRADSLSPREFVELAEFLLAEQTKS